MISCPACQRTVPASPGGDIPYRCAACGVLVLGSYCDLQWIGGGGMGDVYRAREPEMGNRTVAIKVPKTEIASERAQRRFEREIAASAKLQHDNVIRAYHRGQESGRPYLVMEFVSGCKLSEYVRENHPLSPLCAARVLLGIARGLAHAGDRGVINRDIKPENVILAQPEMTPKIHDYGLALIANHDDQVTRSGSVLGTPSYTAPEQFRDPHSVTIAADVYSLGCTAYFCLTNHAPFAAAEGDELYEKHAWSPRPSVRDERPDVPVEFDRLIQWAMAPEHRDRPTPQQLIEGLTALLPTLNDQRPWIPAATPESLVDVQCPGCGTSYHLAKDSLSKRIRCPNRLCNQVFAPVAMTVAPAVAEAVESKRDRPEILGAELAGAEPLDAEVLDAEALHRDLGLPTYTAKSVESEASKASQETPRPAAGSGEPTLDRSPKKKEPPQRKRRVLGAKFQIAGLLFAVTAVCIVLWIAWPREDADQQWTAVKTLYDGRKWSACVRRLDDFERTFPDHPKVEQIPFFRDMCLLGDDVYSATGNPEQGLARLQKLFSDRRDNPAYKDYCIDLYMALAYLIEERFLKNGDEAPTAKGVADARVALGLLKTVNEAIKEPWVAEKTAKLASRLENADRAMQLFVAEQKMKSMLAKAQSGDPAVNADKVYGDLERLLARVPALRSQRELVPLLGTAYKAETARVRFTREDLSQQKQETPQRPDDCRRQGNTLAVVWDKSTAADSATDSDRIVLALARGILYVFDAKGSVRWARRLGVDSCQLPERITTSKEYPASLVAVDAEDNSLLALNPTTGDALWRYRAGSDIVAPLTIVPRQITPNSPVRLCGLLPTSEGEIHVVEMAMGRRLGRFVIGQPMTVGGTYDPESRLAFFPADAKRIFAIDPMAIDLPGDPKHPPCRSILFTNHASGSLRSKPSVVGQYLIISEATELEHTKLRAFEIAGGRFAAPVTDPDQNRCFPRPSTDHLKEQTLRGWAWFSPHATPDRITLVTDDGELGIFGLNLDNSDEAIYRIVKTGEDSQEKPLLPRDSVRALVIAAEEHLLWVMAGGELKKVSLDVMRQQIKPVAWEQETQAGMVGIPIHEAQTDRQGKTFYLATMAPSGRLYHFAAVSSETGARQWQRQLGLSILGDPVLEKDCVKFIDQTGQMFSLCPGEKFKSSVLPRVLQLPGSDGAPSGADDVRPMRLGESPDAIHVVVPLDRGKKLAVRRIGEERWSVIPLPEPLQGRPGICGRHLVVPCADGQLYRCPLDADAAPTTGDVTFTWSRSKPPGTDMAEVYPLGPNSILLVDARQRIRRLTLGADGGVTLWQESGKAFYLPSPMQGQPLLSHNDLFVCDSSGTMFRLDANDPSRLLKQWSFGMKVTAGPAARNGGLLLTTDDRKLVWIDPGSSRPRWVSKAFQGRVIGMPLLSGDTLLVADGSPFISGVRISDGRTVWRAPLDVRSGPASTPAPYGQGKMLAPLVDGTLLLLDIPSTKESPVEARK